jgi:hypothetical protein
MKNWHLIALTLVFGVIGATFFSPQSVKTLESLTPTERRVYIRQQYLAELERLTLDELPKELEITAKAADKIADEKFGQVMATIQKKHDERYVPLK